MSEQPDDRENGPSVKPEDLHWKQQPELLGSLDCELNAAAQEGDQISDSCYYVPEIQKANKWV